MRSIVAWVCAVGIIFGTVWAFSADDLAEARELETIYARKLSLLKRLENLPTREAEIRRQLADLGNEEAGRYLYQGDHRSIQVMIQRDIRQLAATQNVAVGSMRSLLGRKETDRLARSTIQLNLSTTNENLVHLIGKIEAAQPMLQVDKLSIRKQRPSTDTQPAILAVVLEVSGFRDILGGN
jgi:hypothetical protein